MNSKENLTYYEIADLVSRVPPDEKEVTTSEQKRYVNKTLLRKLRGLDYLSRSKLTTLIIALSREQEHTRDDYKESLYRYVSIIDQVEKEIETENRSRELASKVLELPPEKQRDVLEFLERRATKK